MALVQNPQHRRDLQRLYPRAVRAAGNYIVTHLSREASRRAYQAVIEYGPDTVSSYSKSVFDRFRRTKRATSYSEEKKESPTKKHRSTKKKSQMVRKSYKGRGKRRRTRSSYRRSYKKRRSGVVSKAVKSYIQRAMKMPNMKMDKAGKVSSARTTSGVNQVDYHFRTIGNKSEIESRLNTLFQKGDGTSIDFSVTAGNQPNVYFKQLVMHVTMRNNQDTDCCMHIWNLSCKKPTGLSPKIAIQDGLETAFGSDTATGQGTKYKECIWWPKHSVIFLKYWKIGGHRKVNLKPGEEVKITIKQKPFFYNSQRERDEDREYRPFRVSGILWRQEGCIAYDSANQNVVKDDSILDVITEERWTAQVMDADRTMNYEMNNALPSLVGVADQMQQDVEVNN